MTSRTRARSSVLRPTVLVVALAATACGWRPADEQIVERFFELAELNDTTRLARVATTAFDPAVEGVVERFEVIERRDARTESGTLRRAMRLRALVRSPAGRPAERTLEVTLEGSDASRMKVTAVRRTGA